MPTQAGYEYANGCCHRQQGRCRTQRGAQHPLDLLKKKLHDPIVSDGTPGRYRAYPWFDPDSTRGLARVGAKTTSLLVPRWQDDHAGGHTNPNSPLPVPWSSLIPASASPRATLRWSRFLRSDFDETRLDGLITATRAGPLKAAFHLYNNSDDGSALTAAVAGSVR